MGNKLIERELVIEFGSEHSILHHGLCLLPSRTLPGTMISDWYSHIEFRNSPDQSVLDNEQLEIR